MQIFDDLIHSYLATGQDPAVVKVWYQDHAPSAEALSALAERIGKTFLAGKIDFTAANGLLNQLMPLADFDTAPKRFWQYYVAFEDSETSDNPDKDARPAVAAIAKGAA